MPQWYTILNPSFLDPKWSQEGLALVEKMAGIIKIPSCAHWSAFVKPVGIVIYAKWEYEDELAEQSQ